MAERIELDPEEISRAVDGAVREHLSPAKAAQYNEINEEYLRRAREGTLEDTEFLARLMAFLDDQEIKVAFTAAFSGSAEPDMFKRDIM